MDFYKDIEISMHKIFFKKRANQEMNKVKFADSILKFWSRKGSI